MFAGSIAGVAEHTAMYPMDTIKTHMQCPNCPGDVSCPKGMTNPAPKGPRTIPSVLRTLLAAGQTGASSAAGGTNPLRMWRGVQTMFYGCVPAHALYFSSFEFTKTAFGADRPGHRPAAAAACGVVSTFLHDCVMSPFDTIKQRLQLGYYDSPLHAFREVLR
ncbi:hypothetical protein TrRE_jg1539, partial [Triparma retinervis]